MRLAIVEGVNVAVDVGYFAIKLPNAEHEQNGKPTHSPTFPIISYEVEEFRSVPHGFAVANTTKRRDELGPSMQYKNDTEVVLPSIALMSTCVVAVSVPLSERIERM